MKFDGKIDLGLGTNRLDFGKKIGQGTSLGPFRKQVKIMKNLYNLNYYNINTQTGLQTSRNRKKKSL